MLLCKFDIIFKHHSQTFRTCFTTLNGIYDSGRNVYNVHIKTLFMESLKLSIRNKAIFVLFTFEITVTYLQKSSIAFAFLLNFN